MPGLIRRKLRMVFVSLFPTAGFRSLDRRHRFHQERQRVTQRLAAQPTSFIVTEPHDHHLMRRDDDGGREARSL